MYGQDRAFRASSWTLNGSYVYLDRLNASDLLCNQQHDIYESLFINMVENKKEKRNMKHK
jgi:hypothetical protein